MGKPASGKSVLLLLVRFLSSREGKLGVRGRV